MIKRFCYFLLFALSTEVTTSWANEMHFGTEFGYQAGSLSLIYLQPYLKQTFESSHIDFNSAFRGQLLTQELNSPPELTIRSLSLSFAHSNWLITGGFQEIPWGETFGFSVLDIVNPRDYRDPMILDPSWTRLPVAALNNQIFFDRLSLQMIFIPIARNSFFPTAGSSFDKNLSIPGISLQSSPSTEIAQFGSGSEYGGKLGYLFENGLDLNLIYFRHWNRNPVYTLSPLSTTPVPNFSLRPFVTQTHTVGATASTTLGSFVLRNDAALHLDQPLLTSTFGTLRQGTHFQNVIGLDQTFEDDFSVGIEFQSEVRHFDQSSNFINWGSARVSKSLFNSRLDSEIFIFKGLGNDEFWLQPKVTWSFLHSWSASLRWDYVGRSSFQQGYLWSMQDQNRFLFWIKAKI